MKRELDPQACARAAGVLYLLIIGLGIVQEVFIRGRVTAASLLQTEMLWRTGIALELLLLILNVPLMIILYILLRPVQKEVALAALVYGSIATAVEAAYSMQLVEALFPLGRSAWLGAFTPGQLHAMTALAMKAHVFGFGIALLLFGPYFIANGALVFASGYFPRPVGVLYAVAGVAYSINGFALVLAPQFAGRVFLVIAGPAFIGEMAFALRLLVKGVRTSVWRG